MYKKHGRLFTEMADLADSRTKKYRYYTQSEKLKNSQPILMFEPYCASNRLITFGHI